MAAHQAGGSCHKVPAGASTRAGPNGPKIVKNRRSLSPGSVRASTSGTDRVPNHPGAASGVPNRNFAGLGQRDG